MSRATANATTSEVFHTGRGTPGASKPPNDLSSATVRRLAISPPFAQVRAAPLGILVHHEDRLTAFIMRNKVAASPCGGTDRQRRRPRPAQGPERGPVSVVIDVDEQR